MPGLERFAFCPIESRFIDDLDGARSYYAHRFVGDHKVSVKGVDVVIRFNAEETHLFSDTDPPTDGSPRIEVRRGGGSREIRYFNRKRARMMDRVLPTLCNPARSVEAKSAHGVLVYGPAEQNNPRLAVVVVRDYSSKTTWFVRTTWSVTANEYKGVVSKPNRARAAPWPDLRDEK